MQNSGECCIFNGQLYKIHGDQLFRCKLVCSSSSCEDMILLKKFGNNISELFLRKLPYCLNPEILFRSSTTQISNYSSLKCTRAYSSRDNCIDICKWVMFSAAIDSWPNAVGWKLIQILEQEAINRVWNAITALILKIPLSVRALLQ